MSLATDPYTIEALRAAADPLWEARRRWETSLAGARHYGALEQARQEAERASTLFGVPGLATALANLTAWEARDMETSMMDFSAHGAVAQAERALSLLNGPGMTSALTDAYRQLHSNHALLEASRALDVVNLQGLSVSQPGATEQLGHFLEQNRLLSAARYSDYARAFEQLTMVTGLISASHGVIQSTYEEALALSRQTIPYFDSVGQYGRFLDTAGLYFPRFIVRPLTSGERQAKLDAILAANKQPKRVRKAMAAIYQFERTLRQIIHWAMAREYGDDWAPSRLPECGCRKVLSHWEGGDVDAVLDDADFAHYIAIIEYPEHFEKVFAAGFEQPQLAGQLLRTIRTLRRGPYHSRTFSKEEALALRLAMNELLAGLVELMDDHEFVLISSPHQLLH